MAKIDVVIRGTEQDRVEKKNSERFEVWVRTGDLKSNDSIRKMISLLQSGGANLDGRKAEIELESMRGQLSSGATITLSKSVQ